VTSCTASGREAKAGRPSARETPATTSAERRRDLSSVTSSTTPMDLPAMLGGTARVAESAWSASRVSSWPRCIGMVSTSHLARSGSRSDNATRTRRALAAPMSHF
jgi:hypothetical protein